MLKNGLMSWVTWGFLSDASCLCVLQLVTMRMDWLKQRTAHLLVSRRSRRRKLQPHSSAWPPHIEGTGTGKCSSACCFLFPHQEKCSEWWQHPQQAVVNVLNFSFQFQYSCFFFCICFWTSLSPSLLKRCFEVSLFFCICVFWGTKVAATVA